ncbi:MAG: flagellar hook-length control protein FliK [Syntrophobacterales bacterium]|jgi:hypothetical protein|nr:flagellar hook-length control protein FliK [Syntrophobacterales bacterium]
MEMFRIGGGEILLEALLRGRSIQNLLPNLTVGDRLQGQIARNMGEGRVLVQFQGVQVEAETTMPLKTGQKINVQVESLKPQVMLRLLTSSPPAPDGADKNISQFLKIFRSNPQAAADLFQAGMTMFKGDGLAALPQLRDQFQALDRLIQSLIFSDKTVKNPLFVRDFVQRSGLTMENILSQNPAKGDSAPPVGDNLKSALMKLAADIQKGIARSDMPEQGKQVIMRLAEYADKSVRTLETQQVINTVMRENENRFMLQIPFALPFDTAMQDIFIEFEDAGKEKDNSGDRPFRIVFFLMLDALGEMIIDVAIKGQELTADLSCQREGIAALVRSHIDELKENLESLGFQIAGMTCNVRTDIPEKKQNYLRHVSCYEEEVVNIFA